MKLEEFKSDAVHCEIAQGISNCSTHFLVEKRGIDEIRPEDANWGVKIDRRLSTLSPAELEQYKKEMTETLHDKNVCLFFG